MLVVAYSKNGPSSVMSLVERPEPVPGVGEVAIRVVRAGVNPTDWKFRQTPGTIDGEVAPGKDGAGIVHRVGPGVTDLAVGDRVWLLLSQHRVGFGTAAGITVQPQQNVIPLPTNASFDLGACLGVPFVTAHRLLTSGSTSRLSKGALTGNVVLVAGGAGLVGNAAIQLARWAGATVITTVSTAEKEALARAAGAHHVVNYTHGDAAAQILGIAPDGVDVVAEVAPGPNAQLDIEVTRNHGTVAIYANDGGDRVTLPIEAAYTKNLRYQFMRISTLDPALVLAATLDVTAAMEDGAIRTGPDAGLPLHHFGLADTAAAHDLVERGCIGKVLIDVADDPASAG